VKVLNCILEGLKKIEFKVLLAAASKEHLIICQTVFLSYSVKIQAVTPVTPDAD
jgi:hypothetical protein